MSNYNHNHHRGRGNGRGRGHVHARGRPPGGPTAPSGGRAPIAPPRPGYPHAVAEIDAVIQQWPELDVGAGGNVIGNVNRRGGPWRGGTLKSGSGAGTPRRGPGIDSPLRGDSTPRRVGPGPGRGRGGGRGRGRGRGGGSGWEFDDGGSVFGPSQRPHVGVGGTGKARARTKIVDKDAPLSDLLYAERPLLRPVKFVRATLTPFLFLNSEEMLRSASDAVADTTHVPTADRVSRVFRENTLESSDSEPEDRFQDALEEVDFANLAQIRAQVDAIASGTHPDAHEDIEEVDFADLAAIRAQVDAAKPQTASQDDVVEETFTGVFNNITDTVQVSSSAVDVQLRESISTSRESLALEPSIDISHQSHHESATLDAIAVEEGAPRPPDVPAEGSSSSTLPGTDTRPASIPLVDLSPPADALEPGDGPHPLFVIDTTPSLLLPRSASDVILLDRTGHGDTLGDQDDELIVYVAPHPRSGRASPVPAAPHIKLPHTSVLTGKPIEPVGLTGPELEPVREVDEGRGPTHTVEVEGEEGDHTTLSFAALSLAPGPADDRPRPTHAGWRVRKKEAGLQRKRQRQSKRSRMGFDAFGAMVSEAQLRETGGETRRRTRWETRRRGDSDLDWGTEDEGEEKDDKEKDRDQVEDEVDALSNGLSGMEIDPDLDLDVDAMEGFLKSMSAQGSRFVTMDDIEDEARMQLEDKIRVGSEESADSEDGSSDDEEEDETSEDEEKEEVFDVEERMLIAESEADGALSLDSSDDDQSPRSRFRSRLHKVRQRSHPRPKAVQDEDEDGPEILPPTCHADDDAFLACIEDILEENAHVLSRRDLKLRKGLIRQLHQGHVADERDVVDAFLDDPEFTTPVREKKKQAKKGKGKQGAFAAELEAQWAKDRAKKAARKQARAEARLLAASDPLRIQNENGTRKGKASWKAVRAAAWSLEAVVDGASLEAEIRQFVADARGGLRKQMSFPPMDKETRKWVHEMASAFGLKSKSMGREGVRYMTLTATSYAGVSVREGKVRSVVKRFGGAQGRGEKARQSVMPRHREGDEVGKAAPKIGESNIGFKMLASMGWSEGARIGGVGSASIETPLTAIIKHSKLGLGATR